MKTARVQIKNCKVGHFFLVKISFLFVYAIFVNSVHQFGRNSDLKIPPVNHRNSKEHRQSFKDCL